MNEQLSALLDGELTAHERDRLLQEISRDPAMRAAWERYHMIGAALRSDIGVVVNTGLAARVERRIAIEPQPTVRTIGRLPMRHFTRLAGGLALAASVAAVAVFSFKSVLLPDPLHVTASTPAADIAAVSKTQVAQDSSLNALLVRHNEFSPAASINGMMPYVRLVSHSNDQ